MQPSGMSGVQTPDGFCVVRVIGVVRAPVFPHAVPVGTYTHLDARAV